jgi:hypothetical protein
MAHAGSFQPGDPRINRKGRPLGRTLSEILREVLDEDAPGSDGRPSGRTVKDVLARKAVRSALEGDFRFFKEILERTEGRVVEAATIRGTAVEAVLDANTEDALDHLCDMIDDPGEPDDE